MSLEEAGDRLKFTFMRLPPSQWGSARTTNAIERLHEGFKRRIKTQTADTAAMLFWGLPASGPDSVLSKCRRSRHTEFQHKSRRYCYLDVDSREKLSDLDGFQRQLGADGK